MSKSPDELLPTIDIFADIVENKITNINELYSQKLQYCINNLPERCLSYVMGLSTFITIRFLEWVRQIDNYELLNIINDTIFILNDGKIADRIFYNRDNISKKYPILPISFHYDYNYDGVIHNLMMISLPKYIPFIINMYSKYDVGISTYILVKKFPNGPPIDILECIIEFVNNRGKIYGDNYFLEWVRPSTDSASLELLMKYINIFFLPVWKRSRKDIVKACWYSEKEKDEWIEIYQKYKNKVNFELPDKFFDIILQYKEENKLLKEQIRNLKQELNILK